MSDTKEYCWYCLACEEVPPEQVTYDERCENCGSIVRAIPLEALPIIESVLAGGYDIDPVLGGWFIERKSNTCSTCGGSGKVPEGLPNSRVADWQMCPTCHGTGVAP